MAANDTLYGRTTAADFEYAVQNTHASVAIAAGDLVTLDASNPLTATQQFIGVNQSTTDDEPFGVALEAIAIGKQGRVACGSGQLLQVVADSAISAGAAVQCSTVGKAKTQGAGKPAAGRAITAAAGNNDRILIKFAPAKNA